MSLYGFFLSNILLFYSLMKKKNKLWLLLSLCAWATVCVHAQDKTTTAQQEATFRFVAGSDMLFSPWGGNGDSFRLLSEFITAHRDAILSGTAPVRVNGYCASAGSVEVRRKRASLMSNRVKSELIRRDGLREEHFLTENSTEACGDLRNVVVVRIALPRQAAAVIADTAAISDASQVGVTAAKTDVSKTDVSQADVDVSKVDVYAAHVDVYATQADVTSRNAGAATAATVGVATAEAARTAVPSRWSVGLNAGIPFFWGDMVSMSADKTYPGFAVGVQGSYRLSSLLSLSLSADYARGKAGARDYSRGYRLAPDGNTFYSNSASGAASASLPYGELYSRISLLNLGLALDVNLNRLLGSRAARSRFTVWVSPAVYGQMFSASIRRKADDAQFSDGTTKPAALSLGLGGALSLRYRISPAWSVQLKNSLLWLTDNKFDGVVTPYDHARQNALWMPQVGVIWTLNNNN